MGAEKKQLLRRECFWWLDYGEIMAISILSGNWEMKFNQKRRNCRLK
jgi:hypothetical protein